MSLNLNSILTSTGKYFLPLYDDVWIVKLFAEILKIDDFFT